MYVLCGDIFSDNETTKQLVSEEDLMFCELTEDEDDEESKTVLLIRLKNCTGNIIRLEYENPCVNR